MRKRASRTRTWMAVASVAVWLLSTLSIQAQPRALHLTVDAQGNWSLSTPGSLKAALTSGVAVQVDGHWLHSAKYPHHTVTHAAVQGDLGAAEEWQIVHAGLAGAPELVDRLRVYTAAPFVEMQVTVRNATGKRIHIEAIRTVDASGDAIADLGGPPAMDRVLSDSFSEDRPAMRIHDLADAPEGMHRGVGSQLIYNRQSGVSLFAGALTSDRFLTILRLHVGATAAGTRITHYEIESTGSTEMAIPNALEHSPPQDRVTLQMPVGPGGECTSERLLLGMSKNYHSQLETYGSLIRTLHHAHVDAPPLMGWWSWTAYYFGINQGTALTNAEWLAQHLKPYGYDIFHVDEGYQYARGEYATPDATAFPNGVGAVEYQIRGLGLTPGIWTAPFEVSIRSWVYEHHRDWLVKNEQGQPIHAGTAGGNDPLFVLDTTHPGAQQYLRDTYAKLVRQWQIHYIKLDFMEDTLIEGRYYRPNTTALEAQRIGLQIIRDAVGNDVYLDKDGSPMLNPVGIVDYGRISQDTGHTFQASLDASVGIAARYYMNRNFYVSDPDAFTVSTQTIADHFWHESRQPLSLDAARISIALSAIAGGMFEIGDNLPSLMHAPDRIALLENRDLLDMMRLSRASTPLDLMNYAPSDAQPSIFWLRESARQSILTVFDWTAHATDHDLSLSDLGLNPAGRFSVEDMLEEKSGDAPRDGRIHVHLEPHTVRMLKIVDEAVPARPPALEVNCPGQGRAGETLLCTAQAGSEDDPVLSYLWDFGDGVQQQGARARHAWTEPGDYTVHLTAAGLQASRAEKNLTVHVTGNVATTPQPERSRRFEQR